AEGRDQTRGWFYTLTVLSVALFDEPAFKNVIVSGIVMAEDGKKMSKRLRNYTPPDELMEAYGADALRLYLINSGLLRAEEQRFSDHGVKEMVRRTLLPWFNAFKFLQTYAKVDQWDAAENQQTSNNIVDRWLISRLQSLKTTIAQHMQGYQLYYVVPELLRFIDDLTNCYIRLNRKRFWEEGLSQDKQAAYTTLFNTVKEFTICMAPFTPFLAEHIYQQLQQLYAQAPEHPESIHLCDYPQASENLIDAELERAVMRMQKIILLGRQKRNEHKIKVKIPLHTLTIIHKDESLLKEIAKLEDYIKKELNVKAIEYVSDEDNYIKLYAKPCSPRLGKRLAKEFPRFTQLISNLSAEQIESLEEHGSIQLENEEFSVDDILIFREAKEETEVLTDRYISIQLSTDLDQSLLDEGLAREVINRIQKSRKELNFNVDDRVHIQYQASAELATVVQQYEKTICQETLALSLTPVKFDKQQTLVFTIDEHEIQLQIQVA
ncbi:MAG: DUF5915 domain-containing protein, partial [Gammaproteobacteria bacterium]